MRSGSIVLLAISMVAVRLGAQVQSIGEGKAFNPVAAATALSSPPVWQEVLDNHGTGAVTALQAVFRCPGSGGFKAVIHTTVSDPLVNYGHDRVIPSGGHLELNVPDPTQCSGGVAAALFSDGHTEGDPQAVNDIYLRRRGIYDVLEAIAEVLDSVERKEKTTQEALAILSERSKLAANDSALSTAERTGISSAYSIVKLLLSEEGNWGVPSDLTEHRGPGIREVMQSGSVSHEQAFAMVTARKIREWHKDLEGSFEPVSHPE